MWNGSGCKGCFKSTMGLEREMSEFEGGEGVVGGCECVQAGLCPEMLKENLG